jgi:ribosomal subunit interface protein
MNLRVSGKNLDLGESLRNRVTTRITEAVEKYFDGGWSGHVTVGPEGPGFRAECVLHLDSGIVLQAQGEAQDPILSCDGVAERIEKRLRRYKRRLKDRRANGKNHAPDIAVPESTFVDTVLTAPGLDDEDDDSWNPAVVAESTSSLQRMTVRDAVLQLDLTGAPVMVFLHAGHGRVNVVYRRSDGHIGWIDPPSGPK